MNKRVFTVLLVTSLAMFVISVFLPCLSERGTSPLAVYPPICVVTEFWSFQTVTRVYQGSFVPRATYVSMFQDYWFTREYYPTFSQVWLMMFVFQLAAVVSAILSIVKEKARRSTLMLVVLSSAITILLCYFQFIQMSARRGFNYHQVNLESGFFITFFSFALWVVSFLIYVAMHARSAI